MAKKLPNADRARIDRKKITEYLLCRSHPDGMHKAAFFESFGFKIEEWEVLADAFRRHGQRHFVAQTVESEHGTRYSVDGEMETPDGRNPELRTVWIVELESDNPRFVTAYPI